MVEVCELRGRERVYSTAGKLSLEEQGSSK